MQGWWTAVLEPLWDRIDAIQRADIAHHQATLATRGLAGDHARACTATSPSRGPARVGLGEELLPVKSCGQGPLVHADGLPLAVGRASTPGRPSPPVVSYGARGAGRVWQQPGRETPRGCPT